MSVVQKLQTGTWRRYSADDGGYYYHNEENDQSVWDPPGGWVDEAPPGGGVAMDQLNPDGKTVPRSSSQLSNPVGDKPNRPSHTREASQDTTMSPGEVQSMKREAAGSSAAYGGSSSDSVVRSQPPKNQPAYSNNHDDGDRNPCACFAGCSFCCFCVVFGVFIAIVTIIVLATVLTLPQTVSCHSDDKGYFVVVYDGPNLTSVTPTIICTSIPTNLTFVGSGFVKYGGATPQITLGSWNLDADPDSLVDCEDIEVRKETVQTCKGFTVALPLDDGTNQADASLTVTNPSKTPHPAAKASSSCQVAQPSSILLVRTPNVTQINPVGVCEKTVGVITITGGPFSFYQLTNTSDWIKPSINLESSSIPPDAITPSACTWFSLAGWNNASQCSQLIVQISANLYGAANTFTVQNPSFNGGCASGNQFTFRVLAPSTITSAVPNALCWKAGATAVTLYGNFLEVDGVVPTITFDDAAPLTPTVENCTTLQASFHTIRVCAVAKVTVAPQDRSGLNTTYYKPVVKVISAIPGCGLTTTPIATFPNPIIDPIPPGLPALCSTAANVNDQTVTISGSFLVFNGDKPTFKVGTVDLDPSRVNPVACNPVNVPGFSVSLCTQFSLTIPNATVINAPNAITITYPAPLTTCSAVSPYPIFSATGPTATSLTPTTVVLNSINTAPVDLTLTASFQTYNNILPLVHVGATIQRNLTATGCDTNLPQTCTGLIITLNSTVGLTLNTLNVVVDTGSCSSNPQTISFT